MYIHDIIENNGKTIKQNNLEISHNIPVGTLVEMKTTEWYGDGACSKIHARLWVIYHSRDCDGRPLYTISKYNEPMTPNAKFRPPESYGGIREEDLTIIDVTDRIRDGYDSLEWDEEY